jgi:chromate transporter
VSRARDARDEGAGPPPDGGGPASSHGDGPSGGSPPTPPGIGLLTRTWLKISLLGFGGPSAHVALMLDEVVERRRWLTREGFLEVMALINLLPGPNTSEVGMCIGYMQRGWRGMLAAGLAFLVPTWILVTTLSVLYFRYGTLPQVEPLLWGLKPVIVGVVLAAGWRIGRAGVKNRLAGVLAVAGAVVSFLAGQLVIVIMALGGGVTWWARRGRRGDGAAGSAADQGTPDGAAGAESPAPPPSGDAPGSRPPPSPPHRHGWLLAPLAVTGGAFGTLGKLASVFVTHLWIGAVMFGGGYVLVALLEPFAVGHFAWLTRAQFMDGVAISQSVPGPISTLSAFVGYSAAGIPGAFLGTAGIYLPAFAAVALLAPRIGRLREIDAIHRALEGIVAVVAGAIVGVGASLATAGVRDPGALGVAAGALVLSLWKKVPAVWLVGCGVVVGVVRMWVVRG